MTRSPQSGSLGAHAAVKCSETLVSVHHVHGERGILNKLFLHVPDHLEYCSCCLGNRKGIFSQLQVGSKIK